MVSMASDGTAGAGSVPQWHPALNLWGRVLGAADSACVASMRLKPRFPSVQLFGQGWGDLNNVESQKVWFKSYVKEHYAGRKLDAVQTGEARSNGGSTMRTFYFDSPMKSFLPSESHMGEFELVTPTAGPVRACVLILPGTGDSTYAYRRSSMAEPLARAGIASILLMPAYVGSRKPKSQWLHYVPTVEALCLQSGCVISEGLALLGWAKNQFPEALLGVTGLSWGGGMAGVIGCAAKGYDLAIVPCLACGGPDVLVRGSLSCELAIDQLVGEGRSVEQAKQELLDYLGETGPRTFMEEIADVVPDNSGAKVLIQVQAAHDTFVPPQMGIDSYSQLQVLDDKAELVWIRGGHVSAFARATGHFLSHILAALQRLDAKLARSAPLAGHRFSSRL